VREALPDCDHACSTFDSGTGSAAIRNPLDAAARNTSPVMLMSRSSATRRLEV